MKMKVIIDIDSTIDPHDALYRVARVIESGKTSKITRRGQEIPHYCWTTIFADGILVHANMKARLGSAESFVVRREPKLPATSRPQQVPPTD